VNIIVNTIPFFERNINNGLQWFFIKKGFGDIMISIGIYKQGQDLLIGACDENLLGKEYKEGKFHLRVDKNFYGGKTISEKMLQQYLKGATIANLVGDTCIKVAIKMGIIDPSCIIRINGIPHAQMVRMI